MSSSTGPSGPTTNDTWSKIAPYVIPPVAAGSAIVPTFYGFMVKSAQQTGQSIPRFKWGFTAAPTIGTIIGTQVIMQQTLEKYLQTKKEGDLKSMFASSALVGGISAPALAVFNGQSMGYKPMESLKKLTAKQVGAIMTRESSFLLSLRVSEPASKAMKQYLGDSKKVEYGATFLSGAIVSLFGHPADTALTLWQKGMKVENPYQLMRGGPARALAVGSFATCYKLVKEMLNAKK